VEGETSCNRKAADSQGNSSLPVIFTAVITVAYGLFGMVENIWKDFSSSLLPPSTS
jgi:hypothetical protein